MTDDIPTIISTPTGEIDASKTTVPETRTFRGAWRLEGEAIEVDMDAARDIARDKIRAARKPILEQLDVTYLRLSEEGVPATEVIVEKQRLRDAPADPRIDEAQTPDELEAALDTLVTGMTSG